MIYLSNPYVWFQIGVLKNKHGKILRWLYDMWYEVQEDETGMIYYVYPEFIEFNK
jgi:hypothetical protein